MMQQHNGYWISGTAVPGPPYTTYWTPHGSVLRQRLNGSVVGITRFTFKSFELEDDGLAERFGAVLAQLLFDTSHTEIMGMQREIERRAVKLLQHR